jgi:hypothetical protein
MSETPPSGPFAYRLRVALRGVSLLTRHRILIPQRRTIAHLDATFQIALRWNDDPPPSPPTSVRDSPVRQAKALMVLHGLISS